MTLTNGEIYDICNAYGNNKLSNTTEIPVQLALSLCRNIKKLSKIRTEIVEHIYSLSPVDKELNDNTEEDREFIIELNKYRDTEREVEIETVPMSLLPENISMEEMEVLYFMIEK